MNLTLPSTADHFDIAIPVDSMPVGEQIFGAILISGEGASGFVAYSMNVPDCSTNSGLPANLTPSEIPIISSATSLPTRQLMIAFEFKGRVLGQSGALVADKPYRLASFIN